MKVQEKSTEEQCDGAALSLPSRVSRRAFLAGAAACAATGPTLLRAAARDQGEETVLHLATREASRDGYVHTFALTSGRCGLLGATVVDSLAALAVHPFLPMLYIARDCPQWEGLPRGVVETYAVERGTRPLRLLARTPMALFATGPRSLAVSSCGQHLLVSASTGGAWNTFALDHDGMPTPVAIVRKETGLVVNGRTGSLPTPQGIAFSPHRPFAAAVDPGSGRLTLLQPSSEAIAVLARCEVQRSLTASPPMWTSDGRYVIVANPESTSLSIYEVRAVSGDEERTSVHLHGTTRTSTPVTALLAHPTEPAVFTSRPQAGGSRLERWQVDDSQLRGTGDTWIHGHAAALVQHAGGLWVATNDRLIRVPIADLRSPFQLEVLVRMRGIQAFAAQSLAGPLDNV